MRRATRARSSRSPRHRVLERRAPQFVGDGDAPGRRPVLVIVAAANLDAEADVALGLLVVSAVARVLVLSMGRRSTPAFTVTRMVRDQETNGRACNNMREPRGSTGRGVS